MEVMEPPPAVPSAEEAPNVSRSMETQEDAQLKMLGETATQSKLDRLMDDFNAFDEVMRVGTRQRRERDEFRVSELRQEMTRLEKKLEAEVRKRIEISKSLTSFCEEQVVILTKRFEQMLDDRAKQVDDRLAVLAQEIARVDAALQQEKHDVPLMIDQRTGELMQTLHTFMDQFEAERKRRLDEEQSIRQRISDHEHATTESFEHERHERETQYVDLKATLETYAATRLRGDERFQSFAQQELAQIQNALVAEAQTREREDDEIIAALNRYTGKLQESLHIITSPDD